MTTFLQGAIIGGTAAYLCRDTKQAAAERAPQTWARVAMQANHGLWVLGAVFEQVSVQSSVFVFTANAALVLTPVAVLVGLLAKQRGIGAKEADMAAKCSRAYRIAIAVCSVALLALGNYAGGLAALSVLALGWVDEQKMSSSETVAWRYLSAGTAIVGGLGFTAWVVAEGTALSRTALIATAVLSLISWASGSAPNRAQPTAPTTEETPPGGPHHGDATIPLNTDSPAPPPQLMPTPSAPPKSVSDSPPVPRKPSPQNPKPHSSSATSFSTHNSPTIRPVVIHRSSSSSSRPSSSPSARPSVPSSSSGPSIFRQFASAVSPRPNAVLRNQ